MRQSRLFVLQDLAEGALIALDPAPSHYLRNVLRVTVATPVTLFNGQGGEHLGHIASISKSAVGVQLRHFSNIDRTSPLTVNLGLCITKRDAMDTAVQMATELGGQPNTTGFVRTHQRRQTGRSKTQQPLATGHLQRLRTKWPEPPADAGGSDPP